MTTTITYYLVMQNIKYRYVAAYHCVTSLKICICLKFNTITARGFGDAQKYSQDIILGISEDAIVFHTQRFYIGATLGAYIKSQKTDRISSKFTFGQKFFIGLKFLQNSAMELYVRHFSNGSLTELNSGQNFMGLSYTINF